MPLRRLLLLTNVSFTHQSLLGFKPLEFGHMTISRFLLNNYNVLLIPFGIDLRTYDEYEKRVQFSFPQKNIKSLHRMRKKDYINAVADASAIFVGGGNTFQLLHQLKTYNLIDAIRNKVLSDNVPYVGWAAGCFVAAPDISTCDDFGSDFLDFREVFRENFRDSGLNALNLVPYNLNQYYNETPPKGYIGEFGDDHLKQCVVRLNRPIVTIGEGIGIRVESGEHRILGTNQHIGAKIWLPNHTKPGGYEIDYLVIGEDILPVVS